MSEFMKSLKAVIDESANTCITENGAVAYNTTGKKLLDLNFRVSSLRLMTENEKRDLLTAAYNENKRLFIKWLFFVGDVREGCGERELFKIGLNVVADDNPEAVIALLKLIPEYTRWDNLVAFIDNASLEADVMQVIRDQLNRDMEALKKGEGVSLLAKWMPSINTSSSETKRRAYKIARNLGVSERDYRKLLSALRKQLDIVEVKMSAKRFSDIDYSAVPGKANIKYEKAFLRNDFERRNEFLKKLMKGETKINGEVVFPHEVVHMYMADDLYDLEFNPTAEGLWKALPDYVYGQGNTICVADGSGSMNRRVSRGSSVTAMEVCNALAIYFSEHSSGQFRDKFITFSENPQLVDLSGCSSLMEKLVEMSKHYEVANTNIEKVFDIILEAAVANNMKQEEIPDVLVLSDMEFDQCVVAGGAANSGCCGSSITKKDFDIIRQRYQNAGYKLPRVTFWNICSSTGAIPVKGNDLGVGLVSGFSPAVMNMVLSKKLDPWEILMEQVNSRRYDAVSEIVFDFF